MLAKEMMVLRENLIEDRAALIREIEEKVQETNFFALLQDQISEFRAEDELKELRSKVIKIDKRLQKLN